MAFDDLNVDEGGRGLNGLVHQHHIESKSKHESPMLDVKRQTILTKIYEIALTDLKMADSEIPHGKIEDFVDSLLETKIMKNEGCQTGDELLNPSEKHQRQTQMLVQELSETIQSVMRESQILIARVRSLEE